MIRLQVLALVVAAAVVGCLAGELVARLDDWQFAAIPLLANPSPDDLRVRRDGMLRGAPGAQFGKWRLNSLGFRGPELLPRGESCQRIVVLGASESFGYYESPNKEYPAALRELIHPSCRDVVNTSIGGITLRSMRDYWRDVVMELSPDVVVIYPNPFFYLESRDKAPRADRQSPTTEARHRSSQRERISFRSRLMDRVRNAIDTPDGLEYWLNRYKIDRTLRERGAAIIATPPVEGLHRYRSLLVDLVAGIRKTSTSAVILLVPARRTAEPDTTEDFRYYTALRTFSPGVSEEAIAGFAMLATDIVRDVGAQEGIPVVDLDAEVTGCRECFGDLVHFTDAGAAKVAQLIAQELNKPVYRRELHAVQ